MKSTLLFSELYNSSGVFYHLLIFILKGSNHTSSVSSQHLMKAAYSVCCIM